MSKGRARQRRETAKSWVARQADASELVINPRASREANLFKAPPYLPKPELGRFIQAVDLLAYLDPKARPLGGKDYAVEFREKVYWGTDPGSLMCWMADRFAVWVDNKTWQLRLVPEVALGAGTRDDSSQARRRLLAMLPIDYFKPLADVSGEGSDWVF
jgi:hypothetical protein